MLQTGRDENPDVMVVYRIKNLFAVAARADHLSLPEHAKLMRNGRHRHIEGGRDIAYAQFPVHERGHDPDPRRVAQDTKKVSEIAQDSLVGHPRARPGDFLCPNGFVVTVYVVNFIGFIHTLEYMLKCSYCQERQKERIFTLNDSNKERCMEFNITTPALLFSAITLLMLAYTNRFLAIAALVRQFVALYDEKKDERILRQIANFSLRLSIIKYTQFFGVLSFFFCVLCMTLIFFSFVLAGEIIFGLSLLLLMASLALSLWEIFISIDALTLELKHIERKKSPER